MENAATVGWIAAIIIGGVAGWLAEQFMKSNMGLLMNIVLGIVGAVVANALLGLFGVVLTGWIGYLIAGFIGAPSPDEVIFVRGATEGINLVAQSWGGSQLKAGDRILLSTLEHHSNIVPWQLIAERQGAEIDVVPLTGDGRIDLDSMAAMIGPRSTAAVR